MDGRPCPGRVDAYIIITHICVHFIYYFDVCEYVCRDVLFFKTSGRKEQNQLEKPTTDFVAVHLQLYNMWYSYGMWYRVV